MQLASNRGTPCLRCRGRVVLQSNIPSTRLRAHSSGGQDLSHNRATNNGKTLTSLDALLGPESSPSANGPSKDEPVPWWKIRPQQVSPPRQQLMNPSGTLGRFIQEDLFASRVRTGRATRLGEELDLPKVEPFFCYLLIAIQLSIYAAGTGLGVTAGPEAAQDWALTLSLSPEALQSSTSSEYWHLLTTLLLHSGLPHLALDTFMLGYMASEAEAVLGHWVFLSIYLLAGLTGSVTTVIWGSAEPTAGATTAVLGIVGAMIGYELRNKSILQQQQQQQKGRKAIADSDAPFSSMKQRGWISRPIAGLGLLGVTLLLGMLPEGIPSDNAGHLGGITAGVLLGYLLGPKFVLTREVEIPMGSMMVPEDADETMVVVDQRGSIERLVVGVTYLVMLWGIASKAL